MPAEMHNKLKILLVDDDPRVLNTLYEIFREEYDALTATDGGDSLKILSQNGDITVVVMDIKMSGMDGIVAAREIRKLEPELPIIFHTGYPGDYDEDEIDEKERPFDYVQKGEPISRLTRSVRNAADSYLFKRNSHLIGDQAEKSYGLIGQSLAMRQVYKLIRKVAMSDVKVIISGETGTGKGLVARAIHNNGRRKDKRFAVLSCNHKSPDIIESELFGHIEGAFTGAIKNRVGLFEYADCGTLLLDEIGDLDLNTQVKLLGVLDDGEYQTMGSPIVKKTDVRVICATHKNLENLVEQGQFREDLYFRLKGVKIDLPPLRERKEDIPLLVEKFKDCLTIEQGFPPKIFDQTAIAAFFECNWPGNVRQLLDSVESLIVICDSDIIMTDDVNSYLGQNTNNGQNVSSKGNLTARMREFRRICIIEALNEAKNNISAAAKILGIDRANLRKMIKDSDINIG
jgi:DNA-binding NtrC family response regulator